VNVNKSFLSSPNPLLHRPPPPLKVVPRKRRRKREFIIL
jgi:hypothetical protein